VFLLVTVIGVLLDQATKWWVVRNLALETGEIVLIDGWVSIVHAQNPGAAFGMLRDFEYRHYIFVVFTIIAAGVILDLFRRLPKTDWFMSLTLGLILSGAVGNAIDRVRQRVVTDFIRVYTDVPELKRWLVETFGTYEWPSFNVADAALVVGVGMFVLHSLFVGDATEEEAEAPSEPEPDGHDEVPAADADAPAPDDVPTDPEGIDPAELPTDPGRSGPPTS
jgi:signal peptidase II